MASKGQKYKQWTAEEKYKIIKPALDFEKSKKREQKRKVQERRKAIKEGRDW